MNKTEFGTLISAIRAAYVNKWITAEDEVLNTWYEMLKDLDYSVLAEAVNDYIRSQDFPPSIAQLRKAYLNKVWQDWSLEWQKLVKGARQGELNEAAQFALCTITRDAFEYSLTNPTKTLPCMKEFERLYNQYIQMDFKSREQVRSLGSICKQPDGLLEQESDGNGLI